MNISIFGLGYVGCVSAACFAAQGHKVVGVDVNPDKVAMIGAGQSPIIEPQLTEMIKDAVQQGKLVATQNTTEALYNSDLSMLCVGTPNLPNGNLDLRSLQNLCEEIGAILATITSFHTVVIRSTVLPGTIENILIPILEKQSGLRAGHDFGVGSNPEFLREGSAVADFYNPPKTVFGATDMKSTAILRAFYKDLPGPKIECPLAIAEMVKYADNAWHATKITFANEIGALCKHLSLDSHQVMDIFCQDTKLNISPHYLRPGFAFGGSCLPKDTRALCYKARSSDIAMPLLNSLLPANQMQLERGLDMIFQQGKKKVGILGFSFKPATDDLRESPMVDVIERLIGKGYDLRLYDANVQIAKLIGANRHYILNAIPHIEKLMVASPRDIIDFSEVIVLGHNTPEFAALSGQFRPDQCILDFARIPAIEQNHSSYHGLSW